MYLEQNQNCLLWLPGNCLVHSLCSSPATSHTPSFSHAPSFVLQKPPALSCLRSSLGFSPAWLAASHSSVGSLWDLLRGVLSSYSLTWALLSPLFYLSSPFAACIGLSTMCPLLFLSWSAYIAFLHLTVPSIREVSCLFHLVAYSQQFAGWISEYIFKNFVQVYLLDQRAHVVQFLIGRHPRRLYQFTFPLIVYEIVLPPSPPPGIMFIIGNSFLLLIWENSTYIKIYFSSTKRFKCSFKC